MKMFNVKNLTYYQLLITRIISIVILSILVLSFSLYFSFRSFTLDYIYKSNLNVLKQISNNFLQVNNFTKTYATSLFNDTPCVELMYSTNPDIADTLQNITDIKNQVSSAPFVRSVDIYNAKKDNIYYIGTDISLIGTSETAFDKDFPNLIQKYSNNLLNPLSRKITITPYDSKTADVLTYTITQKDALQSEISCAIAVNVNISWIFNSIYSGNNSKNVGDIYLIDNTGTVKATTNEKYFMSNISHKPFVSRLLTLSNKNGYYLQNDNGQKMLVSYIKIGNPDWIIVNTIAYNYIADSVIKVRILTVIISILTVLLGLLISLFYSKKLYLPVSSLLKKSSSLFNSIPHKEGFQDEFDSISNSMIHASEEIKTLQNYEKKSMNLVRTDILRSILLSNSKSEDINDENRKRLDIQIDFNAPLFLVIFKIDYYSNFQLSNNEYDQIVLKYGLANICKEILSRRFPCETVDMGNDHILAFIQVKDYHQTVLSEMKTLSDEITNVFLKHFQISISTFIGNPCLNSDTLPLYYKKLCDISDYRLVYGHQCVIVQQDIEKREFDYFDTASLNIQVLLDALKLCNLEKIKSSYETIETRLYECRSDDILMAVLYTSSMIYNTLADIEKNGNFVFDESYSLFNASISKLETLTEIKEAFFMLFSKISEKISFDRANKKRQIIEKITSYIDLNYLSNEISSNTISDLFSLTPAYLNKMFRDAISMSIPEYITHLKVKKACEMLAETNKSVDEIINLVGWDSKNYFFTVFKKTTGVTPNEYRTKMKGMPL